MKLNKHIISISALLIILTSCATSEDLRKLNIYKSYPFGKKSAEQIFDCIEYKILGHPKLIKRSFNKTMDQGEFSIIQGKEALWLIEVKAPTVTLKKNEGLLADPYKADLLEVLESCTFLMQ